MSSHLVLGDIKKIKLRGEFENDHKQFGIIFPCEYIIDVFFEHGVCSFSGFHVTKSDIEKIKTKVLIDEIIICLKKAIDFEKEEFMSNCSLKIGESTFVITIFEYNIL